MSGSRAKALRRQHGYPKPSELESKLYWRRLKREWNATPRPQR